MIKVIQRNPQQCKHVLILTLIFIVTYFLYTMCTSNTFNYQRYTGGENTYIKIMKQLLHGKEQIPLNHTCNTTEVRNIFYLKIHKAASTTFQNIMYRFGVKRNLKIVGFNRPWFMPYPGPPSENLLYEKINHNDFKPYNIYLDHCKFDTTYKSYMHSNTKLISVIRDPLGQLSSLFSFFRLDKQFHLANSEHPIRDFLFSGPDTRKYKSKWTRNNQMFHFGFEGMSNVNSSQLSEFLKDIDSKFSYVGTAELFDEFLVLLKRRFNWHMKDILYIKLFKSKKIRKYMANEQETQKMIALHHNFSYADYMLYDYFKEKLKYEFLVEGDSFYPEVQYFKGVKKKIDHFCPSLCEHISKGMTNTQMRTRLHEISMIFSENEWHETFLVSLADCVMMTVETMHFHKAVLVSQFPSVCNPKSQNGPKLKPFKWKEVKPDKNWCNSSNHVVFKFPRSLIDEYFLQKNCTVREIRN